MIILTTLAGSIIDDVTGAVGDNVDGNVGGNACNVDCIVGEPRRQLLSSSYSVEQRSTAVGIDHMDFVNRDVFLCYTCCIFLWITR